jgi:LacI family transcriptional regulator
VRLHAICHRRLSVALNFRLIRSRTAHLAVRDTSRVRRPALYLAINHGISPDRQATWGDRMARRSGLTDLQSPTRTTARRVTLADLAKLVGVSSATVSRALRADPQISLGTQQRVKLAAEQVSYVPNSAARSLVMRRTHTFGLLIPDMTDPIHGEMATGFEQEAAMVGYSVIIANILGDPARERAALRLFAANRADGIAVWGSLQDPNAVVATLRPSPVVFVAAENPRLAREHIDVLVGSIRADEAAGVQALVRHLVDDGRKRFVYVGGQHAASNLVRQSSVREALAAAGLRRRLVDVSAGATGWRSASGLVDRIMRTSPDAIICYDDKLALGLIDALRTAGVRVPHDVAVAGFDDIPFAALSNPRLTTVAQPAEEMGRKAAGMLLSAIRDSAMPPSELLPVRLVVRESTAPRVAPSADTT